jgi:hypothetical protein
MILYVMQNYEKMNVEHKRMDLITANMTLDEGLL